MVGTPGHDAARRILLEKLGNSPLVPYSDRFELPYRVAGNSFTNLLGLLPGSDLELPPLLLGAHYDTCGPLPGGDDNAAAVAILLAMIEPLRAAQLERSIVFAFFDAEEPPHFLTEAMGSTHFYTHQRQGPIHCAVILDLVGHDVSIPGWEDLVFVSGVESDPGLRVPFQQAADRAQDIRLLPTLTRYIGDMSDYHAFRLDERPYLFFSCAQWPHYHERTDTPEKLNYAKMAALCATLTSIATRLCGQALDGPFESHETTDLELDHLRTIAGPVASQLGLSLNTRADIDQLVPHLVSLLHGI